MADYFRVFDFGRQFFNASNQVLSAGTVTVYEAGSSTLKNIFQDNAGVTAHSNPMTLDAGGRVPAEVWTTTGDVKVLLKDSNGSTVYTADNITLVGDTAASTQSEWVTFSGAPTQTGSTTFTLVGDQTSEFHAGRRLRLTDSSTLYGTILTSVFSSVTTVTVAMDSGSLTGSLSAVAYGVLSNTNPSAPYALVHLQSGSLSSATALQFTDLSTNYAAYLLAVSDFLPATDGVNLVCQISTDNGSSYKSGASDYRFQYVLATSTTVSANGSAASTGINVAVSQGNTTGEELRGEIWIRNPAYASDLTGLDWRLGYINSSSNTQYISGIAAYNTAGATNAIQFLYSSGNIATGEYALYGLRTL